MVPPALHQLVAQRATETPDAVAVLHPCGELTYRALVGRATALAAALRSRRVLPGAVLGVSLPDGPHVALALLAAWQAGAAILLIDPDHPTEQLTAALRDCGVGLLLAVDDSAAHLGVPVLRLDAWSPSPRRRGGGPGDPPTGVPAFIHISQDGTALAVGHTDLATDVLRSVRLHRLGRGDRVLHADVAATPRAVGMALASGAALVTSAGDGADAIAASIARHRVTVVALAAGSLPAVVDQPDWADCEAVRLVLSSGPEVDAATCARLRAHKDVQVWGGYGPAECGVSVTRHRTDRMQQSGVDSLGLPIDGKQVLVLDDFGEPVPPGVPGELHVAVLDPACGYPGRPELTAERLVPDSDGAPGARVHRTGDLVRCRNDGTLEHLGLLANEPANGVVLLNSERPPYVPPSTGAELAVAEVWADLLEVDDLGLDDNFFQLGGYSLLFIQLAEALRAASGVQVVLADLYGAVTVRKQAALLDAGDRYEPPVESATRSVPLPLSFGQRRLWLLDQLHGGRPEWVVPLLVRLPDGVTEQDLRWALDALAARHESLRTRYLAGSGEPVQEVLAVSPVSLLVRDCIAEDLVDACRDQMVAPFDLTAGQVWRALLARVSGQAPILLITAHHIACDGWSTTVLERELCELLAARRGGRDPELAPLAVQYADFAAWQRALHDEQALEWQLDFWREELSDCAPLELPTDRPRPAERDGKGGLVAVTVPADVAVAITALGKQHEASTFSTALTAFASLLARHTDQWDVAVGVPVAGRSRAELVPVVGFFLNSLVLRCRLDADLTFDAALDAVRDTCRAAFAHQDVSFEHLVERLGPERDPSRTPLYQVALNFIDDEVGGGMSNWAEYDLLLRARQVAKTDLTLYLRREADGAWTSVFEYASALFERASIERLAEQFLRLLESVAIAPGARLADVDLMSTAERAALLMWKSSDVRGPAGTVLDEIERAAERVPDSVAVMCGARRLTFAELDARANQLAHHLVAAGAAQDVLVGVCLERGPDLVVALLAVWKAGAAYVPVDPANPAERTAHVLADAAAPIVISADALSGYRGTTVSLERDATEISEWPMTAPGRPRELDQLAYVIYTSGSTGKPKGVLVTQGGLANHLRWAARDLGGGGGAPLFSSIAFDLPATSVFVPLMTGAPVHVLPAGLDLAELGATLATAAPYDFVKLTPGHLDLLTDQLTDQQVTALARVVLVAGEALPPRTANRWLELLGPGRLVNEYGPTETSIGATIFPVDRPQHRVAPLGGPLPGTTAYVLDRVGRVVPVGVVGEIYLGGASVARGYHHRPELTAERFVPDSLGLPGSRLYRTGDLGRRLGDDGIEFLGRADDQVKLRGYRIELGEVAAALRELPGVRTAVVVLREDRAGEGALAGYLVAEPGQHPDTRALREQLTSVLPEHMVPSSLTVVPRIPLTSNGKLDRRALPEPERAGPQYHPPGTPAEERIAAIWADVLSLERVSIRDSFFELGGHSILAIRMTSRLQDEFDIDISVRTVFENRTVQSLAQAVADHIRAEINHMSDAELFGDTKPVREQEA